MQQPPTRGIPFPDKRQMFEIPTWPRQKNMCVGKVPHLQEKLASDEKRKGKQIELVPLMERIGRDSRHPSCRTTPTAAPCDGSTREKGCSPVHLWYRSGGQT